MFDTSALNALADEPDSQKIVSGLSIGFQALLSETNLSEIAATSEQARRDRLIRLCRHLVYAGECVRPYNWIIETQTKNHAQNPGQFLWTQLPIRGAEIEEEIVRPEFYGTDELADEILSDFKARRREFEAIYRDTRARFDPIFAQNDAERPTLAELIDVLKRGAFWGLASGIYKRGCGREIDEAGIKRFIEACPPFNAAILSLCVAQFQRCIRDWRAPSFYNAGRLDLFMAVYLPYCDRFITRDPGQYNALAAVAEEAKLATEVCTYEQFRRGFLLAA